MTTPCRALPPPPPPPTTTTRPATTQHRRTPTARRPEPSRVELAPAGWGSRAERRGTARWTRGRWSTSAWDRRRRAPAMAAARRRRRRRVATPDGRHAAQTCTRTHTVSTHSQLQRSVRAGYYIIMAKQTIICVKCYASGSICLTVFFIYCVCLFPFAKFFFFSFMLCYHICW